MSLTKKGKNSAAKNTHKLATSNNRERNRVETLPLFLQLRKRKRERQNQTGEKIDR